MDAFSHGICGVVSLFLENTDFMKRSCTWCEVVIAEVCGVERL